MPTTTYYRQWCFYCQDYKLFDKGFSDKIPKCKDCKTEFVNVPLSDIPSTKIQVQRKRYSESQKALFPNIYASFLKGDGLKELFSQDFSKPEIVETDAGQKEIDEIAYEIRKKEIEKEKIERQNFLNEAMKYRNLTRNDICLCGSGKKYKNCCITKYQDY